jgi:competence protein ComEC
VEHIQSIYKRNLYILVALWGFVFGVLVASFVFIPPLVAVLIVLVALVAYYAERHVWLLILLVSFSFGVLRFDIKDFHEPVLPSKTGVVVSDLTLRDFDTRFVVRTDSREKVLITTDLLSKVRHGDRVNILGKPQLVESGSYAGYLSKDDIYYTYKGGVEVVSSGHGHPIKEALLSIKNFLTSKMKDLWPEPESSLLSGLIVSGKDALPKDTLEGFRRAGVVHMVVLSGYNVAVIAGFLFVLFATLGSRKAATISILGVIFFVVMSGGSATVVRGAIMTILVFIGRLKKREGSSGRIMLFTLVLMLIYNPKYLVFDASFQLSFLAVVGLVYGTPIIQGFVGRMFPAHGQNTGHLRQTLSRLIELVSATLATQILVLPFLLYNMGNFSLVFLLSNLLILPVVPVVMFVGFLATILSFLIGFLAYPLVFISHLLLKWILFVAESLGNLPFAEAQIENFPLWGSLVLYAIIFVVLLHRSKSGDDLSRA